MTYDGLMEIIINSEPEEWLYDDEKGVFVFKNDLLISIVAKEIDYEESGKFYEDWATSFPNSTAYKAEFDICYAGTPIETLYTAMVDGARMYIPYPALNTMTLTRKKYKLGKIINVMNEGYGFDTYLQMARISVEW